ncbi:hypothetical protein PG997_005485 [Apiospora hydei]|uniref:Uncharacterized protein n=1 Tax=Apiospora hydei TaxID=1337664 RepID=A0ABR1WQ43_9PEZI
MKTPAVTLISPSDKIVLALRTYMQNRIVSTTRIGQIADGTVRLSEAGLLRGSGVLKDARCAIQLHGRIWPGSKRWRSTCFLFFKCADHMKKAQHSGPHGLS